ncbi:aldehyde dehydrogenase (plasmid) [Rhizobium leguminosarum]|jgi:aldehyde dehydrogenase (NAD+)|uniref:aldehyde dehydrogenase n=1 Tax=Rhizobium leguminosarum TaxID=384 RepID=UPI0003778C84|nr:aldehyde dehydrogenase [Rhizobium leguminosarum]MDH6661904.1 acyl-CoA reductase-like NAD-dependent aldehyde dehydrogenase [Rhizobium sophorae]AVC47242.1 aldehyde dehydrogenase family protein [Rhizobium leguminosarum bv. viciae]MBB4524915.1 aldehyde dehydrogenase (NAD+) [Rhizobium leguminosarum]MBP2490751.1 aldehyde dehydrogenase (NAD+) [Rhizobium leguminosarum]MBY5496045.1 aldehyde dehydrogenase [Rhizobium leguminosarum]
MQRYQLFIDGAFTDAEGGEWIESEDPYQGKVWAEIARATPGDVDRAVNSAVKAMERGPWSKMTASARGKVLRKIGDLVVANADRIARIEARDNGKLLTEVRGQLNGVAECWYYFSGLADKIEGSSIPIEKADTLAFTLREPIGVVAALTAWNSPIWFATVKCAPALAAGCSVVVKPSEFASASTLELAALVKEAGMPDGVFNVVTGFGHDVGAALVEHPGVTKITFTGSDATGAKIYETAARHMKRVSLELGGKSPNIVFEDANLDLAAAGVVSGIFGASGQMCTAGSRLLVHKSIKEAFTAKLIDLASHIKLGDPMDPNTNVGPIATAPQFKKVLDYLDIARADGARCILGGYAATGDGLTGGQFVQPTIFSDVTNSMRIAQEEVFGPILSIIEFNTEDEAIEIGNDIAYGLVAGVWTQNIGRAMRMTKALKVGTVWVNTYRAYSYMMPFGGMKKSGLGREGGIEAINEYLETKSVFLFTSDEGPVNPFIMR